MNKHNTIKYSIILSALVLILMLSVSCNSNTPVNGTSTTGSAASTDTTAAETITDEATTAIPIDASNFNQRTDAFWGQYNFSSQLNWSLPEIPGHVFINYAVDEVIGLVSDDTYIALYILPYKGKKIDIEDEVLDEWKDTLKKIGVIFDMDLSDPYTDNGDTIYYATPAMIEKITAPDDFGVYIFIMPDVYRLGKGIGHNDFTVNKDTISQLISDVRYNVMLYISLEEATILAITDDGGDIDNYEYGENDKELFNTYVWQQFYAILSDNGINEDISYDIMEWNKISFYATGEDVSNLLNDTRLSNIEVRYTAHLIIDDEIKTGRIK